MNNTIQNLSARYFRTGCPCYGRIGHKLLLKGSNILVFGGTNYHGDFVTQALNINCQSYQVSSIINKNSIPIQGFSLHQHNDKIYLWGGRRSSGISNELWKYQNGLFVKISQKGNIPTPRYYHTSILFSKKYIVIYGGMSEQLIFNDWHCLNLQTYTWTQLQSNLKLPINYEPKMAWIQTRGILLISQIWNEKAQAMNYCNQIFQLRIRRNKQTFIVLIQELEINYKSPFNLRGSPTICKYITDTVCLAIIGGERIQQSQSQNNLKILSDAWILNLETLEADRCENVKLYSKYGHEALFYKDRILMVGGISSTGQFSCNLQTIDLQLKMISVDRKLCQSCKIIYNLQDYSKIKYSIRCQYQCNPKSYIPAKLVKKFSQFIDNPLKAFGLLMDNSLNMNANLIEINLEKIVMDQKIYKKPIHTVLQISDNSYGFTKEQIVSSFFTFGYQVERDTHDLKFEEEVAVRKEYGLNLKLASIRLGKSCLVLANTIQQQKFIGYFSIDIIDCPQFKNQFSCFYYFINGQNNISSQINRHIIRKNVQHVINIQCLQKIQDKLTKIYILDFDLRQQFQTNKQTNNKNLIYKDKQQSWMFLNIKDYLKTLYFKPYFGRTIKFMNQPIICQSVLDIFKKDQNKGKIKKIDFQAELISIESICLYEIVSKDYIPKGVYIYSSNRLIDNLELQDKHICGFIVLKQQIETNIGKGSIQSQVIERKLKKQLMKIINDRPNAKRKYQNLKQGDSDLVSNLGKTKKKIK